MKRTCYLMEAIFSEFVDFDFFHEKEHSILFHIDNSCSNMFKNLKILEVTCWNMFVNY